MQIFSWIFDGITPKLIEVQYHARFQIPSFSILGLTGPEIQEARERITAAFHASKMEFPKKRLIINLAPASMRKWGTGHDLSIAFAILQNTIELTWPKSMLAWGELGLDGSLKPRGQIMALIELLLDHPMHFICLTSSDASQWQYLLRWRKSQGMKLPDVSRLVILDHLKEVQTAMQNPITLTIEPLQSGSITAPPPLLMPLTPQLEHTIDLAMTGKHHLLLLGPRGIGKSQSIEWIKALQPKPSAQISWLRALRSGEQGLGLLTDAPFRQIHSQVKPAHLLGSWRGPRLENGELALAHGGVLVADEFLEWPRDARECLREPLQEKRFSLSRVQGKIDIHCDVQFVATGNLCPCGGMPATVQGLVLQDPKQKKKWKCRCRPHEIANYLGKLSGPIADRIDLSSILHEVPDPGTQTKSRYSSLDEWKRLIQARRLESIERFGALPSELSGVWLEANRPTQSGILKILGRLSSLRSRHKTLRIARTLQCIQQTSELREEQVFEASTYRIMDHFQYNQ